jgi:hypothetical protein
VPPGPFAILRQKACTTTDRSLLASLATMLSVLLYLCIAIVIKAPNVVRFGTTLFR